MAPKMCDQQGLSLYDKTCCAEDGRQAPTLDDQKYDAEGGQTGADPDDQTNGAEDGESAGADENTLHPTPPHPTHDPA